MNQVHLVMPFSRLHMISTLRQAYRPMDCIWHPIVYQDQVQDFIESWVDPFVIPGNDPGHGPLGCMVKINHFIRGHEFIDEDYYILATDDGMFEPNVFEKIKQMDDDVVIISLKRGYQIPKDCDPLKAYPTNTLLASPFNVRVGYVSGDQVFVKGKYFKTYLWDENSLVADGLMAIHMKENYNIRYEPDLYSLFNYYEPGRWDKREVNQDLKISFGCMVSDPLRLNMVLQQSELQGSAHYIQNAESATKGLNLLLDKIEAEGAEIAVLCHQDMFFRSGWLPQVKEQLSLLPDSWIVAGVIGKDMDGIICGQFHDMRLPLKFNTKHIHYFPHPACCFDEAVIIVNLKKGFRFDESLDGFDLYGTLCVLQTWEMGGTAWILDAYCEHYCMRLFSWYPDDDFVARYKWLYDRYENLYRVDSTALGLPADGNVRFETSAAA